jgi:hypothetical protein
MAAHEERSIFKRQIAQLTAEHPRGSEDEYFHLLQRTMAVSPWVEYRGGNCLSIPIKTLPLLLSFHVS